MVLPKPVYIISLRLEFPAPQICQVLDVIDIVKGIPGTVVPPLTGKKLLQLPDFIPDQARNTAGNAPMPGIGHNCLHHRPQISGTHREGINRFPVELGKQHQPVPQKSTGLPTPDIKIGKRILAAPGLTRQEIAVIQMLVLRGNRFERNHNSTSFVFYCTIFKAHHARGKRVPGFPPG
jgi:hypothetical protein